MLASPRRMGLGLLLVLMAARHGARAEEPACPGGEITLSADLLRMRHGASGADVVRTRGSRFTVPEGVSIDPGAEALTFAVVGDHQVVYRADVPAGALASRRAGAAFVFRERHGQAGIGVGSRVLLRRLGASFRMDARFARLDLAPPDAPQFAKLLVKIGDDCFSALLACTAHGGSVRCAPERSALLRGRVKGAHVPLPGAMLTAFDDGRLESVSVFAQENGAYAFPHLRPGTYRLRARLVGWADSETTVTLAARRGSTRDFALQPAADTNDQLPASSFFGLLLDQWPDPTVRGDFTLACGNCHQIAGPRFREDKDEAEWTQVVTRMIGFLPPYHDETRGLILPNLLATFGPDATVPTLPLPAPPSGDALRAVVYEYGLGDATSRPGCHDLELGTDGILYADSGIRWIDPRTGERGTFPMNGGGHSIERAPDGNMWITQNGTDTLTRLDVRTGAFTYYPLPRIGDDQGSYPHTLRFDAAGHIWFTLSKSNHVARFDPDTAAFTYHRLPEADPAEVGLSIPVPYGCDPAPDGGVWWSQLFGQRIGRIDPTTGALRAWRPPFYGPRRLHADADGIVWIPGYGSGVLGRFDPAIERWKVYDLPTGVPGPPGFGTSETPYALNTNRRTGEVWVTGSDSDTLVRFDPRHARFTAFPLPTRGSFTREIEFDPDNNVWTCTSNEPDVKEGLGRGKFVKIELPPREAVCGNGRVEDGEECDDRNTDDCDACSNACTRVTGCGDGVVCGAEPCDDGNADDCDGCSATCAVETGLRCGDGVANQACGEACDPPAAGTCSPECQRVPRCGDGIPDPGEECDDGDADDCDACSNACTRVTGCGDGIVCGAEQCDDGGTASCDGCTAACETEAGIVCGDGIVNAACGEECDPPGAGCNYLCGTGPAPALGTRHLSFGGSSFSSALGTAVPIAALEGALDLVGGTPGPDGTAPVTVGGPLHYRGPILGGAFGTLCFRVASCTGLVDCDGGTAVGVTLVQDSAGPGKQGNPKVLATGLGADGGPGAVLLTCEQGFVQLPPGPADCTAATYPPAEMVAYTTGQTDGHYVNGNPRIGTGAIAIAGENFSCAGWTLENGPGRLATSFLIEEDPQAGDTANANLLDD